MRAGGDANIEASTRTFLIKVRYALDKEDLATLTTDGHVANNTLVVRHVVDRSLQGCCPYPR